MEFARILERYMKCVTGMKRLAKGLVVDIVGKVQQLLQGADSKDGIIVKGLCCEYKGFVLKLCRDCVKIRLWKKGEECSVAGTARTHRPCPNASKFEVYYV